MFCNPEATFVTKMQFDFSLLLLYDNKINMPKGGRLPLDFFVIGESTPNSLDRLDVGGVQIYSFFRRAGFNMMSPAATGLHPRLCKTASL